MCNASPGAAAALAIARNWDANATVLESVRVGENCVFRVQLRGEHCALRLTNQSHRTRPQLEGELAFIDHLSTAGLHVARALPVHNGVRILEVPRETIPNDLAHATVFQWLSGRHFAYRSADIDQPLFRLWGATMARLHERSVSFVLPHNATRPDWFDDPLAGCSVDGVAVSAAIAALRAELLAWLRDMRPEASHYGTVHGDFERTNFLLDGERLGLFDFDDCCRHWFAWDITCALWVFRNETAANRERYLAWFLEGYSTVREPDEERMQRFSELVRLRTLALVLHRLRNAHLAKDADWIERTTAWLLAPWTWARR